MYYVYHSIKSYIIQNFRPTKLHCSKITIVISRKTRKCQKMDKYLQLSMGETQFGNLNIFATQILREIKFGNLGSQKLPF